MNQKPIRVLTEAQSREAMAFIRSANLRSSAEPHAVCPERRTRRDGSLISFLVKYGCPFHGEDCKMLWEPVTCDRGADCRCST